MTKIRTLIVDDEPLAREGIRVLLQRDRGVDIVGECDNGREAVAAIETLAPDLVFLDVQMPEMDGFEVLAHVHPDRMPVIVFVTAYDEHALRAFDVHALDYLLKPYKDERFLTALERAKTQIQQQNVNDLSRRLVAMLEQTPGRNQRSVAPPVPEDEPYLARLVVKAGGRVFFIKVEEIDWIEAADYYVRIHVGGKSHLLRETMTNLEQQLDPRKFLRIHRSTIVQLDRVVALEPYFHGDYVVLMQDGTQLKMSRRQRHKLETWLGRSA
ncbi:MAG: LytR/AlgR family response regulator transcription factor [Rhodothermales bacterium]